VFDFQPTNMADKELKEYTADEVSKHTTQDDCWLVIGNQSNGKLQKVDITIPSMRMRI